MPKTVFKEWCQRTVFHGVKDFYDSRIPITKIMWFLVIISGSFFAFIQSVELILSFAWDFKWVTVVSTEEPESGYLVQPNLTICSQNPFDNFKLTSHGFADPYEMAYLLDPEEGVAFFDQFQADTPSSDLNKLQQEVREKVKIGNKSLEKLIASTRLSCEDVLIQCGHMHGFRKSLDCNCSKFSQLRSKRPECFKIDVRLILAKSDVFRSSGTGAAMKFLLNPKVNDFYPHMFYDTDVASGIRMYIYFGEEEEIDNPILIRPGSETVIAMKAERRRTTIRKKRVLNFYETDMPCLMDTTGQYETVDSSRASKVLCQWDCYGRFLLEYCQCVFNIPNIIWKNDTKICSAKMDKQCWTNMISTDWWRVKLINNFNYTNCIAQCKDPCEFETISFQMSSVQFPAPAQLDSFTRYLNRALAKNETNKNFTRDDVSQFIQLVIYYASNEYTLIETVNRASLDELISSIGGTLGVWTGLSLIGIFQALVYIWLCTTRALCSVFGKASIFTVHENRVFVRKDQAVHAGRNQ